MELKYYLRGLGLGIAITAVIMGIVTSKDRTMTNEEIIARARQLGMTEDTVLTEINSGKEDDQVVDESEESPKSGAEDNTDTEDEKALSDIAETDLDEDTGSVDSGEDFIMPDSRDVAKTTDTGTDAEPGDMDTEGSGKVPDVSKEPVVITIGRGDGSYVVSKKLADVGAVVSADDFDTFLCQNGYDKRIRSGTYTIPANASEEQMARIITGLE